MYKRQAFCYDGYIETDDGVKDALIAEGGVPGADEGYAIAYLYEVCLLYTSRCV